MARKCWALKMSKSSKSNCFGAENDETDKPLDLGKNKSTSIRRTGYIQLNDKNPTDILLICNYLVMPLILKQGQYLATSPIYIF